jgi:quinol monooxygenase YgiN
MHAVAVTVDIDPDRADEADKLLNETVVPNVKQQPGFISGTWARSADKSRGHSMVLFDSEEHANAGAEVARAMPPEGAPVKVLMAHVFEVMAQA